MIEEEKEELKCPENFAFPFEPYSIQVNFMKALYQAIEEKKIGIFESPTGTGKSLSLICGALTWLQDHEKRVKKIIEDFLSPKQAKEGEKLMIPVINNSNNENEDIPWMSEYIQQKQIDDETKKVKKLKEYIEKVDICRKNMRDSSISDFSHKKKNYLKRKRDSVKDEALVLLEQSKKELERHQDGCEIEDTEDEQFDLDEYESDEEKTSGNCDNEDDTDERELGGTKIYFCSRTHSQLSQFVDELRKSPFGKLQENAFPLSVSALASRKSLCVNDSVKTLGSLQQINERCLEMQSNSKKNTKRPEGVPKKRRKTAEARCCYLSNGDGMSQLTSKIVGKILDIEDLVKEGKDTMACPYYAVRNALPYSHLVVLPYQTLLHEATRSASGIDIKDSVIIIDEAHNLVEAINAMYSNQITAKQLAKALNQLSQYSQRFNKKLKAKNLFYVKQLLYVLRSLLYSVASKTSAGSKPARDVTVFTLTDFLCRFGLDNINFFKLLRYCARTKISMKLNGFVEKYEVVSNRTAVKAKSALTSFLEEIKNPVSGHRNAHVVATSNDVIARSPLMHIESFLMSLTSSNEAGRVVLSEGKEGFLKFLQLNPASHFKKILDQCRSLIVAGGTMQPSSCMIDQLLPRGDRDDYLSRIVEFSCGHVIDGASQLLPIALSCGSSGESFEFTFEKRNNDKQVNELGRSLVNVCNVIPGGIVCFFPSYEYESFVHEHWKKSGIIDKLEQRKKIFRESKTTSQVDQVLTQYSQCIRRTKAPVGKINGALLLSVVGGKMSEGINFADDLGRCVVMVGLPYPSLHSAELKEKMAYLDVKLPRHFDGRTAGQVHYESLCMKAVNQSIGRAIRHRSDYACLLLLDQRYRRPSVANKLPRWIGEHLRKMDEFGQAFAAIRKFFNDKR